MWEQRKDNIEWEKREIEKAEEERANPEKTLQKQRRRKRRQNPIKEHKSVKLNIFKWKITKIKSTAGDAIRMVEKAKQKSSRINYDVLSSLKEALTTKHPAPVKTPAGDDKLEQKVNLKKEEAPSDESSDEEEQGKNF